MDHKFHGSPAGVDFSTDQGQPWLPPGFRFHPTDEELVTYYLAKKIENSRFTDRAITEADLNKSEPWELPGKAQMGEKEWYFYSLKDRKYPTGMRTNRATEAGYWKATGKDREVMSSGHGGGIRLVGMKKTLVFYTGRAPKGVKTNWVMHEYRAEAGLLAKSKACRGLGKDEWVVCRVFHKSAGGKKMALTELSRPHANVSSTSSLPPLMESPIPSGRATSPLHAPLTPELRQASTSASACNNLHGAPDGAVSGAAAAASSSAFRAFLDQYNSATKPRPPRPSFDHLLGIKPEPYVACQLGDVQLAGACHLLQASTSAQQLDGVLCQAADVAAGGCVGSTAADLGNCFNIDYLQAPVVNAGLSYSSSLSQDMGGQYLPRFPSDLETLMGCLNASTANGLQARFL